MPVQLNVVSISGGKDSLATALVCLETQPRKTIRLVHADTGHEHPITVEYLDYLEDALGLPIERLRADFSQRIEGKRKFIAEKWPLHGMPQDRIDRALEILQPTGIPFLDLCLWKGRFPSRMAQFCTTELKALLLSNAQIDLANQGYWVWSWQGVRADESRNRRHLPEWQDMGPSMAIYRPILRWPASATFEAAAAWGVEPNPLYKQGMRRVGCMPCINAGKGELSEIAKRWPWVIEKIAEWELLVSDASKRGVTSFFPAPDDGTGALRGSNIRDYVEWAKTDRGGRQHNLFASEVRACESSYGLCE